MFVEILTSVHKLLSYGLLPSVVLFGPVFPLLGDVEEEQFDKFADMFNGRQLYAHLADFDEGLIVAQVIIEMQFNVEAMDYLEGFDLMAKQAGIEGLVFFLRLWNKDASNAYFA
jgi:hypothetical protein